MAYAQSVLQRAEARLAQARSQHDQENRGRIDAIYAQHPRLQQIDRELRKTAARVMAASFRSAGDPREAIEELKRENLALQQEREWILESNDIDPDDLNETPICPVCGGSGYNGAVMCDCLRELCRQEQKKELLPLLGSGKESFERFRLDVYPDQPDENLHISPRMVMQRVLSKAQKYARTFDADSPSLLFMGPTGLGKTFLSACIARVVADKGCSVVYEGAGKLFSDFEAEKFGRTTEVGLTEKYLNCDLLIVDDLGTEMATQLVTAALYQVVNSRLMAGKPTIISTNLPVAELERRYSAQIASRLLGCYETVKFIGKDIRLL